MVPYYSFYWPLLCLLVLKLSIDVHHCFSPVSYSPSLQRILDSSPSIPVQIQGGLFNLSKTTIEFLLITNDTHIFLLT